MKPVMQRQLIDNANAGQRGDCLRAVIASLLELDLDDVPHFMQDAYGWEHLDRWLAERGLTRWPIDPGPLDPADGYAARPGECYIAIGAPSRCVISPGVVTGLHAVVYRDDQMAHDPYPGGDGLAQVYERWAIRPIAATGREVPA